LLAAKTTSTRIRPYAYFELSNDYGWYDIKILQLTIIDDKKRTQLRYLNKNFRDYKNEMNFLSILILAKKK